VEAKLALGRATDFTQVLNLFHKYEGTAARLGAAPGLAQLKAHRTAELAMAAPSAHLEVPKDVPEEWMLEFLAFDELARRGGTRRALETLFRRSRAVMPPAIGASFGNYAKALMEDLEKTGAA
jgi:hypothetical protein